MRARVFAEISIKCGMAAALLTLVLPSIAQSPDAFRVVGVKQGDSLNVRAAPKSDAAVLLKIPFDASGITRVGECKVWCLVRYDGIEGWVDRRYLEALPTSSKAAPPAQLAPVELVSTDPVGDCNSDENARKIAGCSAIIKGGTADPAEIAIAYSRKSDAHIELLNLDVAVADRAKALVLQPDDSAYQKRAAEAYILRGADRHSKNKLDGALADYTEAIRIDPANPESFVSRSGLFLLKNDYDKAIADLRAASGLNTRRTIYGSAIARLYEDRGVTSLLKKDFDRAIGDFTEGIQADSARESLFLNRSTAHVAKKNYDDAYKDCVEATRVNPDNASTYMRCGELTRLLGLPHQAILHFDEVIKRDPANIAARMMRGLTYEDTKQFAEAIKDYDAVLKHEPTYQLAKEGLARLRNIPK